jgi:hypothetical protein
MVACEDCCGSGWESTYIGRRLSQLCRLEPDGSFETAVNPVAIRNGQNPINAAGFITMGTVRCDGCGEEFLIGHAPEQANPKNAERQAKWLEKVLAYDHECDRKHGDRIVLPD